MRRLVTILSAVLTAAGLNAQDMELKNLNRRQQAISAVASNTAAGNTGRMKTELALALDAGLTVNEIREVLVQMYAYAGFPRSLNGLNAFMEVLEARKAQGIRDPTGREASPGTDTRDKYIRGKETLQKLTGREEGVPAGANAFAPAIDRFLKEHLFADIFESDVLQPCDRELATVSALAAMEGVEPQLKAHLGMARNTGLTEGQLQEAVLIAALAGSQQRAAVYPQGDPGPGEWFTGSVWVRSLVAPSEVEGLYTIGQVTFEPGGRTLWHTHPAGQILLVTGGHGFYQERGKAPRPLAKGDVVVIPEDAEHWHGASASDVLVHIAVSNMRAGSNVTWMSPVTDEEYAVVNEQ